MSTQLISTEKKLSILPYTILALACIVPMFWCGFGLWLPIYLNDLRLATFADNLYEYPLPPNTSVVNRHSELMKVGNGNNCWYEAQQQMVSSLPRAEIERYYKDVALPRVSFGQWDEVYDSPKITQIDLEFDEVKSNERDLYFTATLFDVGLDVTLDIRCH